MKDIEDLVAGFRRFQNTYFGEGRGVYERLTRVGQSPRVMAIACCDSRVDPAIITDSDPGDLFVVRNVANLVPPWETGGHYHGTSAALEFAVRGLGVEHIIVLGHARCGGIAALLGDVRWEGETGQFLGPWMSIAEDARKQVMESHPHASRETLSRQCELAAIRASLGNLQSFDFVREAVASGRLTLHGWYFDLERGELLRCTGEAFEVLVPARDATGETSRGGTPRSPLPRPIE